MSTETPENAKQLEVTGGAAFRQRRDEARKTEIIELPSNVVVELARPKVDRLIRAGHIPADLAVKVQKMQGSKSENLKGQELEDYFKLVDLITEHSLVNPKIKKGELSDEDYDNGFISLNDLEENDKVFIMTYVQTGLKDLEQFRLQLQS